MKETSEHTHTHTSTTHIYKCKQKAPRITKDEFEKTIRVSHKRSPTLD